MDESKLNLVALCIKDYMRESEDNEKRYRTHKNAKNWRMIYGQVNWTGSKKQKKRKNKNAKLHIPRLSIGYEQQRAKFKQSLMSFDKWMEVQMSPHAKASNPEMVMTEFVAKNLMRAQFEKCDARTKLSDALSLGCAESRATIRIGSCYKKQPHYQLKKGQVSRSNKKYWQLDLRPLKFNQFDTDIENQGLYDLEHYVTNYSDVLAMSSDEPTPEKPYKLEAVKKLTAWEERGDLMGEQKLEAEGRQDRPGVTSRRKPIKITNFFGTILDQNTGEIMEHEGMKLENVLITMANEQYIIRDPEPLEKIHWSCEHPFASVTLMSSPGEGRQALLDSAADLNEIEDNLVSLMVTAGLKSVHQNPILREDWIKNKEVLDGGLGPDDPIIVNSKCPPNGKPADILKTGDIPIDAQFILGLVQRLGPESMLSNQLDIGGGLPSKQVRATEIAVSQQAIGGVFEAMAADIEDLFIERIALLSWYEILQHSDELPEDMIRSAFGEETEKYEQWMKMTPAQRFADGASGFRFRGKGVRGMAVNTAKAQALINLLSLAGANELMLRHIQTEFSISKTFGVLAKGQGIDLEEITLSKQEKQQQQLIQTLREQALAQAKVQTGITGQRNPANASQKQAPSNEGQVSGSGQGLV